VHGSMLFSALGQGHLNITQCAPSITMLTVCVSCMHPAGRRAAAVDEANIQAAGAAGAPPGSAMETDSSAAAPAAAEGGVPPSPSKSPKKGGGLSGGGSAAKSHHKSHRRPSSEVGLRLITCSPQSTLGEVGVIGAWCWGVCMCWLNWLL
jgi:hypothetical protein